MFYKAVERFASWAFHTFETAVLVLNIGLRFNLELLFLVFQNRVKFSLKTVNLKTKVNIFIENYYKNFLQIIVKNLIFLKNEETVLFSEITAS